MAAKQYTINTGLNFLLPGQDILQCLHQPHLVLASQRGLEENLWTSQSLCPYKQLVILCHVEHRLEIKVISHSYYQGMNMYAKYLCWLNDSDLKVSKKVPHTSCTMLYGQIGGHTKLIRLHFFSLCVST